MVLVSVIMPVFNVESYLAEAIQSIVDQTMKDFEFIIIDDGSTDGSVEIIQSFNDKRITFLRNETNSGITASLNKGLSVAKGEFICRMDADDIAVNNSLEKQIAFFQTHRSISLVGSQAILIDEKGQTIGEEIVPQTTKEINRSKFIHNPFIHGTIMFRSSLVKQFGNYDPRRKHNEDYDLWLRYTKYVQAVNLNDKLIFRRIHSQSITVSKELELIWNRFLTLNNAIVSYYLNPLLFIYLIRPLTAYFYKKFFKQS